MKATGMKATQNARERARAQLTREIKEEARRQVAAGGAQQLSLRAVARELGMVSSALYRYYPSRDELLTALIIDAYDSLGAVAEAAVAEAAVAGAAMAGAAVAGAGPTSVRGRWRAGCHAVRDWAKARPHEYALIYGSPVPGYEAPPQTVAPATRIPVVLGGLLAEAWKDRPEEPAQDQPAQPALPGRLAAQAEIVAAAIAPEVPLPVIANALIAWTQLFGMISFELFGQLAGSADPADDFFGYAVEQMADLVRLPA
ncbi:MAG TPA: TetR/AcrR family transcriptional regulator [Streptosporangiaceae bacterium]|nr:TetR/AcrR family transcriptional regulator [Streptosporangiaceae bacterium]